MSAQSSPPTAADTSHIVDLTAGMSDLDINHESGAEDDNVDKRFKGVCLPSKKRKTRRGRRSGKSQKATDLKKANKLNKMNEDMADSDSSDSDADYEGSSEMMSDAGTVSTTSLAERNHPRKLPKTPEHIKPRAVHVSVVPHYEVRTSSGVSEVDGGTATEKHGVFSTQDIVVGTRIICESPAITLPSPGDQVVELMSAFYALPEDQQDKIWSLNWADTTASPLLGYMGQQIVPKVRVLQCILSKEANQRTAEDDFFLANDVPKLQEATKMCRIAARWHAGRYSLVDLPENERGQLPPNTPITGLFVETARLRHSCVPNCYAHYNPATNLMTVHATKAITSGDELTLSTIASVYYLSASDRAAELQAKFGIACACEACDHEHHNFTTHESARMLSHTRAIHLEHFCTLLAMLDSSNVCADLCLKDEDRPDPPDLEDLRDAENTCLALITNLKDTECDGPELIRWYNALIDRIQPRAADLLGHGERYTWWRFISRHAGECVKIAGRAFGEDSIEYAQVVLRLDRIEGLVKGAEERAKELEESKKKVGGRKGRKEKKKGVEKKKEDQWEIVGTVVKKDGDETLQDERGEGVGTLGKYALVRE